MANDSASMVLNATKGKGKGKGSAPPPLPKAVARPPSRQSSGCPTVKVKVRDNGSALKSVSYTIVTRSDGTRELHRPDGTITKVGKDWQDESGNWGIVDETNALGLDGSDSKTEPDGFPEFSTLIARYPRMKDYLLQFFDMGLPLSVVKGRIVGDLGQDAAKAFEAAIAGGGSITVPDELAELQGEKSEKHGRLGQDFWPAPKLAARCHDVARPGYNSKAAHEYLDHEDVLREKVSILANLIRRSKYFVIYAGAGLSTASGIGDYATRSGASGVLGQIGSGGQSKPMTPYSAKPNLGHRVIASLGKEGFVRRFIQQNHDGLPQKAGFPQRLVNEIHGGWFDPSNPVVAMSGSLREDLFSDLLECERKADLVLAVGSSLCGMNSDRLVSTCANRARRSVPSDPVLGSVIIALQRTPHDANSSLRIYATIDRVFELLADEMSLTVDNSPSMDCKIPAQYLPCGPNEHVFSVPYDDNGRLLKDGQPRKVLDLRDNQELGLTVGKNQGAKAIVLGRNADGHYRIAITHDKWTPGASPSDGKWHEVRLLGSWWPAAAVAGEVEQIPLVSSKA